MTGMRSIRWRSRSEKGTGPLRNSQEGQGVIEGKSDKKKEEDWQFHLRLRKRERINNADVREKGEEEKWGTGGNLVRKRKKSATAPSTGIGPM